MKRFRPLNSVMLAAMIAAGACTLEPSDPPAFAGPSGTALFLTIQASPDIIRHDGQDSSVIIVEARDPNGQPIRGQELRFQILVNGIEVDFGQLSSKVAFTDAEGRATVRYTAPPAPSVPVNNDAIVAIGVVPVGTNFSNSAQIRTTLIRLARPGVITPPPPANGAPTASFTFSPTAPAALDEVEFNGSGSRDPDGTVVSYEWNFGDGDSTVTSSAIVEHTYDEPGSYSPSLIVVDNSGSRSNVASQTISVGAPQEPRASFVFSPIDPAPGQTVNFDASASRAPEGRTIVSYSWNFGDGTSSGPTTSPVFQKSGGYATENTFTVTLTVTDSTGRTNTTSQTITVKIP